MINLVQAQEQRRAGWPAAARVIEQTLRDETAEAERLAESNARINETNRPPPEKPPMIPVILSCGHRRSARATVPLGYSVRCHACNGVSRVVAKAESPYGPDISARIHSSVECIMAPRDELNALRELHRLIKGDAKLGEVLAQAEAISELKL